MALPKLAAATDLSARGVDVSDKVLVDEMLEVASTLVREAAGSPISEAEVTVSWFVLEEERDTYLDVPVRPARTLTSLTLDGEAVTDAKLVNNRLWRRCGWYACEPLELVAELTVGLPVVPATIRQLVCDLAILGMDSAADGALDPRLVTESIDDYTVTFAPGAEQVASAMTLPPTVRRSLRARFGGGVGSVQFR